MRKCLTVCTDAQSSVEPVRLPADCPPGDSRTSDPPVEREREREREQRWENRESEGSGSEGWRTS